MPKEKAPVTDLLIIFLILAFIGGCIAFGLLTHP